MRVKRRDWNKIDPLKYFRENYSHMNLTRTQLKELDSGLRLILGKRGLIDQAIPERREQRDWSNVDLLKYFKEQFGDRKITRKQLAREDEGLSIQLYKAGLLDEAIPEIQYRDFNGDPLKYFREHYGNKNVTRRWLSKNDQGLYQYLSIRAVHYFPASLIFPIFQSKRVMICC